LFFISIVPRHSYRPENLYPDSKNRAMLRSFRLVRGLLSDAATLLQPSFLPTGRQALNNTNALYCRAVSCKANCDKSSFYQDFRHASKSFASRPCNRPFAAKHMLSCLPRLCHLDNYFIP
jgi:hypothetical protein